jgi:hypothetical protein
MSSFRNTSDIFEEYARIAIAHGLVSEAEDDKNDAKTEKNDSLSDDAIAMLYGVEPKNFYGKDSILEAAHPDTYVVGRAYDPMNAVVENLQERQNIMSQIALRTPDGTATQKRYVQARSDLINSLVRAGFLMDNRNESSLMKMADSCALRLSQEKKMVKNANPWLIAAGIATVVSGLIGASLWFTKGSTTVQNVYANAEMVKKQAQTVQESYSKDISDRMDEIMKLAANAYKQAEEAKSMVSKYKIGKSISKSTVQNLSSDMISDPVQKKVAESILTSLKEYNAKLEELGGPNGKIMVWAKTIFSLVPKADMSTQVSSDEYAKLKTIWDQFTSSPQGILVNRLIGTQKFSEMANDAMKYISGNFEGPKTPENVEGGLLGAVEKEKVSTKSTIGTLESLLPAIQNVVSKTVAQNMISAPASPAAPAKPGKYILRGDPEPASPIGKPTGPGAPIS